MLRWNALCIALASELRQCSGERHENLPAGDTDRRHFDRGPIHIRTWTAVETAPTV